MSTPEPPSGPPTEAGGAVGAEPGHRARALAASLLGELTGQRKTGLTFSPLEPTGLSVEPRQPRTAEAPSPADDAAPAATPQDEAVADAPVTVVEVEVEQDAEAPADDADGVTSLAPDPEPVVAAAPEPLAVRPAAPPLRVVDEPGAQERVVPSASPVQTPATPSSPVPEPVAAAPRPSVADRPSVAERPSLAADLSSSPSPAAAVAQQAPPSAAPARSGESGPSGGKDVRPAPFAYLAVAQHHTTPARATANGALDQAGQRISSRVDRALVRRAALVTIEAASLLDACDVLDGRARAADATWTGEHHSPTEVREFEGAWGAFYDAQGALAQHVTGS